MIQPRDAVNAMKGYAPPLAERAEFLRLDFNENLAGPSPAVLKRIQSVTADDLSIYPEMDKLNAKVGAYYGVVADEVCLTNGADEGAQCCVNAYAVPGRCVILDPSYSMYRIYLDTLGCNQTVIPYEGENFAFPFAALQQAFDRGVTFCLVGSPNNPTGSCIPHCDMLQLMRRNPNVLFVIDEAYAEFAGETFTPEIKQFGNLLILKTFSKAFGLAGLRVGVVLGQAALLENVKKVRSPYSVDAVSLIGVDAALDDVEYMRAYVAEVRANREYLKQQFSALGVECAPSDANFLLLRMPGKAEAAWQLLKEQGILTRIWPTHAALKNHLRITVGTRAQCDQLIKAMRACAS